MPIIDTPNYGVAAPIDTPNGFVVTPGKDEVDHGSDLPDRGAAADAIGWLSDIAMLATPAAAVAVPSLLRRSSNSPLIGAAFRQGNTVASAIAAQDDLGVDNTPEPDFNPWEGIKGTKYEPLWSSFVDVHNQAKLDARKRQIDREQEDKRTLESFPWYQRVPAELVAGALDLPTLVPGGAFVRGVNGGISIARSAATTGLMAGVSSIAQETSLQATQAIRSGGESALNIGASVFLGGLLGAGGAKLLNNAEWGAAVRALNRDLGGAAVATGEARYADIGGARYVRLRDGSDILGDINPTISLAIGREAAPIRLPQGSHDAVTGKGFGEAHIEAAHGAQIRSAGYNDVGDFVLDVTSGFTEIYRGSGAGLFLVKKNGLAHIAVVELSQIGEGPAAHWQVQTAAPYRSDFFKGKEVLWSKPGPADSPSADGSPFHPGGQSGGNITSAGAAANLPVDIRGNTIAGRAAGAVAAATKRLNPALRLLQSPSAAVRDIATQLFENTVYLKKNFQGVASQPAVETLMQEWNGGLAKAVTATKEGFSAYRKAGGTLDREGFREAVGRAMRRNDEDADPFVAKTAQEWRASVFDPLKQKAIEAGLLPADVSVETAASYFSRMWNRNKLIGQEQRFKDIVTNYYARQIAKEYESSAVALTARLAKLDQEVWDLRLGPQERAAAISEVDKKLERLDQRYGGRGVIAKSERLSELQGGLRSARQAGDKAAAKKASDEIAAIKKDGGEDFKAYMDERSVLRGRRGNLDLNYAGLKERGDRILDTLADIEEANQKGLARLITRGQVFERDLQRLDPAKIESKIDELRSAFADLLAREDAAAERLKKAALKIDQDFDRQAKRAENTVGAAKDAEVQAAFVAADTKRGAARDKFRETLAKAEAVQQARRDRLDGISDRLAAAEGLDRDALIAEIKDVNARMLAVASHGSLAKGERASRLQERLAQLDPKRVEERIANIETMKGEAQRRFYDRWEIRHLGEGVDHTSAEPANFTAAAREIADTVHTTLTGRSGDGGVRPEFMTVAARGPMKERTFNIPDALIEDFLEHDAELVGRRYTRVMGADVELARKFGSPDMREQIQKIRDDYARLRSEVTDEKMLRDLADAERADVRDIGALRDLLRGTRHDSPIEHNYGKLVRSVNHLNYLRSMGEVVLASITDVVRPAMVHGLMPFLGHVGQLVTNLENVKLSIAEARLAGNVTETALGNRLATISEITDPYAARGAIEAFLENATNIASKWNGIRIWTDAMKSIASVLTQNRILQGVERFAAVKPSERAYLAYLGIDQSMAERIGTEFAAHGETVSGVRVANTEDWADKVAVRAYRAALNKDVDSIIVERSVADLPLFASTPTGKALLQFKSFALASHQRVLLRGLQEDKVRFIGGTVAMTTLGMAITYFKAVSGNRPETRERALNNPGWWIAEGLDRSGVLSVPIELANDFEKVTGFNPVKAPFKAFDASSAMSQKNQNRNELGAALGPSFGLVQDIGTVIGVPRTVLVGDEVSKGQKRAIKNVLPFNSYAGIRQMLEYVALPQDD